MCSDGAWLNGWSKLASAANSDAGRRRRSSGCANVKRSGNSDEAGDGDDLRGQQPLRMRVELAPRRRRRRATRRRSASIDQYGTIVQAEERDRALPVEDDRRRRRARCAASQLASAVGRRRRTAPRNSEPRERAPPRPRSRRRVDSRRARSRPIALGERHGEDAPFVDALLDLAEARAPRRAGPSRPACAGASPRPAPPRWLVSARAISSSCGCHGWPV